MKIKFKSPCPDFLTYSLVILLSDDKLEISRYIDRLSNLIYKTKNVIKSPNDYISFIVDDGKLNYIGLDAQIDLVLDRLKSHRLSEEYNKIQVGNRLLDLINSLNLTNLNNLSNITSLIKSWSSDSSKVRLLNMGISKKDYENRISSYSNELINHAFKLYCYKYPIEYDNNSWLKTIAKGPKSAESIKYEGGNNKNVLLYLNKILTNDELDLDKIRKYYTKISTDKEYSSMPKNRVNPSDEDLLKFGEYLIELVNKFKVNKIFTKDEVQDIVNEWWDSIKNIL